MLYYCIRRLIQQYTERSGAMTWELSSDRPIYAQLIEQLELKICAGKYPPGSRMPPVRELAREASVNPNTCLLYTSRCV